jgi:hypothetical protein
LLEHPLLTVAFPPLSGLNMSSLTQAFLCAERVQLPHDSGDNIFVAVARVAQADFLVWACPSSRPAPFSRCSIPIASERIQMTHTKQPAVRAASLDLCAILNSKETDMQWITRSHVHVDRQFQVYDALYAWCRLQVTKGQ